MRGHGLCTDCLEQYFRPSARAARPCPTCRAPFRKAELRQVFLNPLVDAAFGEGDGDPASDGQDGDDEDGLGDVRATGRRIGERSLDEPDRGLVEVQDDLSRLMAKQRSQLGAKVPRRIGDASQIRLIIWGRQGLQIMLCAFRQLIDRLLPVFGRAAERHAQLKHELDSRKTHEESLALSLRKAEQDARDTRESLEAGWARQTEVHRKFVQDSEASYKVDLESKAREIGELQTKLLAHRHKVLWAHSSCCTI